MSAGSFTRDWLEINPVDHTTFGAQPGAVREKAIDISDRIKAFFYGFTSGETTKGVKYLEYCVQGTAPSSAADAIMVYGKDVSAKCELHAKSEDGGEVQITAGGGLNAPALKGVLPAEILNIIFPVGLVVTLGVATNPATLFGIGTWAAIAGKVVVGINAGDAEFDTLNETGGEKTHLLTSAESGLPAHTHNMKLYDTANTGVLTYPWGVYNTHSGNVATDANAAANAAAAHNNLQPYIVKYVWQRTA